MPEVFISYAREDTDFVRRLYEHLVANNRQAWVDWEDIPLTADWLAEAYAGIESADTFIFVISPASVRSGPCTLELEHALEHNKRLVPLLRREVTDPEDQKTMHHALSAHNWLKCRDDDDLNEAFQSILTAIDTDLSFVRAHTRYVIRATEWENKGHDRSFLLQGNDLRAAEAWLKESEIKKPSATDLQREYILASRNDAVRRRRLMLLVAIVLITIAGLALFANIQRLAAVRNAEIARAAEATARYNEEQASSFGLAASAQQVLLRDSNTDLSIALALEANKIKQAPGLARSVLAQAAYAPGTRWRLDGYATLTDTSLAISPDAAQALAMTQDNKLNLLDLQTKEVLHSWDVGSEVLTIRFNPKSANQAVLTLRDGTLFLIDLKTGEKTHPWKDDGGVKSAVFAPDGTALLVGYQNGLMILWSLEKGQEIRRFVSDNTDDVLSVAITSDAKKAVAGFRNGEIIVWNLDDGHEVRRLKAHTALVSSLAFSPDDTMLVSAAHDNTLIVWDVETGDLKLIFRGHTDRVQNVAFSPDGLSVFSGGFDGNLIQWSPQTGQEVRRFVGHSSSIYTVAVSPKGGQILSGSVDGTLRLWDVENGAQLHIFRGHTNWVYGVAFSPDGTKALSASRDNTLILWDITTGELLRQFKGHSQRVISVAFSPDGKTALSTSADADVILWDVETGKIIRHFAGHRLRVWGVAFSPDGRTALTGSWDYGLILWDVSTGQEIRRFKGHQNNIYNVAFSPDGKTALSGSADGTAIWWDIETGKPLHVLQAGSGNVVYDVAFSPDGKTALTGLIDHTMVLWDLATGEKLRRFDGHSDDVFSVAFSPDGLSALSASLDGSVRLWDIATAAEILRFDGHVGGVWDARFSPDGHTFLSGGYDGTVRLWRINSLDELTQWTYANRYIAPLNCDQRRLYRLSATCDSAGNIPTSVPYLTATPTPTDTAPATADHSQVTATPTATTTLTITPVSLSPVSLNQPVKGELKLGTPDRWVYHGRKGEIINVSLKADHPANQVSDATERVQKGLLDTFLIIRNPDGVVIDSNDDMSDATTDSNVSELELPADGDYIIEAGAFNDASQGVYTLLIEAVPPSPTPTTVPAATVIATATAMPAKSTATPAEVTIEATPEATVAP